MGTVVFSGDVTSTAIPNQRIIDAAEAITADSVFGADRFAYRIDADVVGLFVDLSVVTSRDSALSLRTSFRDTQGAGGIDYDKSVVRLAWSYNF